MMEETRMFLFQGAILGVPGVLNLFCCHLLLLNQDLSCFDNLRMLLIETESAHLRIPRMVMLAAYFTERQTVMNGKMATFTIRDTCRELQIGICSFI